MHLQTLIITSYMYLTNKAGIYKEFNILLENIFSVKYKKNCLRLKIIFFPNYYRTQRKFGFTELFSLSIMKLLKAHNFLELFYMRSFKENTKYIESTLIFAFS